MNFQLPGKTLLAIVPVKKILLAVVVIVLQFPEPSHAEDRWQNVQRIVAVGDVHGDFDRFVTTLRQAKVINRRNNWIAGDTHLVQLGDVPDRGPESAAAISLLQKLESQASRDGGKVHALIGNHEMMNMLGDLRYVDAGEYASLRTRNSREVRERFYEQDIARRKKADPEFMVDEAFRSRWEAQVPLGYVEHRIAWSADGKFGAWVLQHNAIIRINRVLFVHGGISSEVIGQEITAINDQIRAELGGALGQEPGLSEVESGPLWYRGLAASDDATILTLVDNILSTYDVDHIVVGHTPGLGTIAPRFDSRVLVIDSGISKYYGGHLASLLIEGSDIFTIQRGKTVPIPRSDAGLIDYYEAILDIEDPAPAALLRLLDQLRTE